MKRLTWFLVCAVWAVCFGFAAVASAEDVVYLKDGSIIHGRITEEVPGKSIKIKTKDGNVFVYKMKLIDKITHSAAEDEATNDGNSNGEENTAPVRKQPVDTVKLDPNAHFSKGILYFTAGLWNPYTVNQINDGLGDPQDGYNPAMLQAGFGLGWLTNNFGLKWNLLASYQQLDIIVPYFSSTAYPTDIEIYGSEVEADLSLDSIKSSEEVTSIYLPIVLGAWKVDWSVNGNDYENYTTDFGTGIGLRGFDRSKLYWDLQMIYRWSQRGNGLEYNSDPATQTYVNGKLLDANVSGLGLTASIGLVF